MKIIDLTMVLEEDLPSDPPMQIPQIQRLNHKDTARDMPTHFPGATVDDMPDGNGWAIDYLQICTHSGTVSRTILPVICATTSFKLSICWILTAV